MNKPVTLPATRCLVAALRAFPGRGRRVCRAAGTRCRSAQHASAAQTRSPGAGCMPGIGSGHGDTRGARTRCPAAGTYWARPCCCGNHGFDCSDLFGYAKNPQIPCCITEFGHFFFFLCQFSSKNSRQQWALCCCVCVRSQTQCCALLRGHSAPACAQAPHKHRTGVPGAAPRAPCPHSHFPSPADAHPGTPQHPAPPVPATWYLFV